MKQYFPLTVFFKCIFVCCFFLSACKKAEYIKTSTGKPEKALLGYTGGNNTLNRIKTVHLYKDTVYNLSEPFSRNPGEELIIDEGTIVKVSVLGQPIGITIEPGGYIMANGSHSNPVIFTSNSLPGNQRVNWGGIIIRGKSINNSGGVNGDPDDFSGNLNYVRIEFASLVLNSIGNKTNIENIQVSYTDKQSSFEIDGGTFNARNLISYANGGPADFYITKGYSGKMQNILAYRHPFFGNAYNNPSVALAGVFIENNPDDPIHATPNTFPIISNLTVLGPDLQNGSSTAYSDTLIRSAALITTGNAGFRIRNSLFMGFPLSSWFLDDSLTARHIQFNESAITYSIFHCNDTARLFYLQPGKYQPYTSKDFHDFVLRDQNNDKVFSSVSDFNFRDIYSYDKGPDPLPNEDSPVLQGANFDEISFNDPFFLKVNYLGAFGRDNWLLEWAGFTPLKTNYNFPQ